MPSTYTMTSNVRYHGENLLYDIIASEGLSSPIALFTNRDVSTFEKPKSIWLDSVKHA